MVWLWSDSPIPHPVSPPQEWKGAEQGKDGESSCMKGLTLSLISSMTLSKSLRLSVSARLISSTSQCLVGTLQSMTPAPARPPSSSFSASGESTSTCPAAHMRIKTWLLSLLPPTAHLTTKSIDSPFSYSQNGVCSPPNTISPCWHRPGKWPNLALCFRTMWMRQVPHKASEPLFSTGKWKQQ